MHAVHVRSSWSREIVNAFSRLLTHSSSSLLLCHCEPQTALRSSSTQSVCPCGRVPHDAPAPHMAWLHSHSTSPSTSSFLLGLVKAAEGRARQARIQPATRCSLLSSHSCSTSMPRHSGSVCTMRATYGVHSTSVQHNTAQQHHTERRDTCTQHNNPSEGAGKWLLQVLHSLWKLHLLWGWCCCCFCSTCWLACRSC